MSSSNPNKLNLLQGISVSIGSIIGSGVLFLPSMTVKLGGADALIGWLLILMLTIPGLFFFKDLFEKSGDNGIVGFVEQGLGKRVANCVPLILLATVIFGMPSACQIASDYLSSALGNIEAIRTLSPYLIILFSTTLALRGIKTSARVNTFVSILLILTGFLICYFATIKIQNTSLLSFNFNFKNVLQSSVLAFWAFAGFENLTFLANDFQNRRDLIPSILIAIVVCGLIYIFLTVDIILLVPRNEINSTTGLMQLADHIDNKSMSRVLVALFALFSVVINMISWTSGVSRAVQKAAGENLLPAIFSQERNHVPSNAILLLCFIFNLNVFVGQKSPELFSKILTLVSSNFLFIYFLVVVSYVFSAENKGKKIIASVLALCLIAAMLSFGIYLLYPIALMVLVVFIKMRGEK